MGPWQPEGGAPLFHEIPAALYLAFAASLVEAAELENKLTLDNLAEGLQLCKTAFDFFYNMDPL